MNLSMGKRLFTIFVCIFLSVYMTEGTAEAYYGAGLGSGYYGLYGGGLYGTYGGYGGLYGSVYGLGLYGIGGLYGGYGGLYGSMFGLSPYGGIYGLGNLYGLGSLVSGFYGLGGLYGIYGTAGLYGNMYGLGGLYGLGGPYGSGDLGSLVMLSLLSESGLFGAASPTSPVAAEQAGTWEGLWSNGILQGPITLNIIQDPVISTAITGYVQLTTNPLLGTGINVTGELFGTQIVVNGIIPGITGGTIEIDLSALLLSSTQMEGNYTLIKNGTTIAETGTFQAVLTSPAI